jgi:hypothetical protein
LIKPHGIQRIVFIVLFSICFFSFPLHQIFPDQKSADSSGYSELRVIFKRYFQLQEELFRRLTFTLSADQVVKEGASFKLTLEDNLGRKWIFKEWGKNRVIAQRLYTLFGLNAPEIHRVQLVLNGKSCGGTLQEFIPGVCTFSSYGPKKTSATGLEYLMKAQAVDWLIRDRDSHSLNFLVISFDKQNRADELMRIDQDCACLDRDESELDYEHMVVIDKDLNGSADANLYRRIEEAYQKKQIDLDLKRAYAFVRFIADFPQPEFEEVIWDLKSRVENNLSENGPGAVKKTRGYFENYLFLNKRAMAEDFSKLYRNMAALRGAGVDLSENLGGHDLLEGAITNLRNKLKVLEKASSLIDGNPEDQPVRISAVASLEGFRVMEQLYRACWYKTGDLKKECENALRTLVRIRSNANPDEKKAISLYMQEVRKIKTGKGMTCQFGQINKLIDPVPQKNKSKSD